MISGIRQYRLDDDNPCDIYDPDPETGECVTCGFGADAHDQSVDDLVTAAEDAIEAGQAQWAETGTTRRQR